MGTKFSSISPLYNVYLLRILHYFPYKPYILSPPFSFDLFYSTIKLPWKKGKEDELNRFALSDTAFRFIVTLTSNFVQEEVKNFTAYAALMICLLSSQLPIPVN